MDSAAKKDLLRPFGGCLCSLHLKCEAETIGYQFQNMNTHGMTFIDFCRWVGQTSPEACVCDVNQTGVCHECENCGCEHPWEQELNANMPITKDSPLDDVDKYLTWLRGYDYAFWQKYLPFWTHKQSWVKMYLENVEEDIEGGYLTFSND